MKKVWLITGCSTGFGRSLAIAVLRKGDVVAVGSRNTNDIQDIIQQFPENALPLKLDVTKIEEINQAVEQTIQRFQKIDVLVNNAGIGYFGAVEESEDDAIRKMFDINVFGLGDKIKAVLPQMRLQRSGHILNIASIGGLRSYPGVGYYNATKYAVDGLSEALYKEVSPLGIKVTIIAPSGFRTDWAGRSANDTKVFIADYHATARKNMGDIRLSSGNQPGDPDRAAQAMIQIVESENPPLRLLLGAGALRGAKLKLEELKNDFENWATLTEWTDNPKM
jgi:NAD(P)-dependent dehydrogenase (short-subunit alcohol dehydrogenase family)